MDVFVERGAGLDVHQATVVACVITGGHRQKRETRTFRTLTGDLLALRDWLAECGVTHVAMESTGVYWLPVYQVLEDGFEMVVGNAHHIKNVPGRKTDVKDAEWIAGLLRHGLIRKSFVPPQPQRALRDLTRYRSALMQSASGERNRLLRLLETANIKLSSVMSDVFGVSGRAMLKAMIDGSAGPEEMAAMARGQLRRKTDDLKLALDGRIADHHRTLLALQMQRLEAVEADVARVEALITERVDPHRKTRHDLTTIPGVDEVTASVILAEIGPSVTAFPTARHLAAWAGVCPGNNESAGHRKSSRTRKGNVHLKTALVQAAMGAGRTAGTYLRDKYHRLKARLGPKKAAMAIAHKIVIAIWHMLATNQSYRDLGPSYLDARAAKATTHRLVSRLKQLGYDVALSPASEGA